MGYAIFAIVSAIISAIGTSVSYEQNRKAASQMADQKAKEAAQATQKAQDQADVYSENSRRIIAQQKANFAAAGFDVNEQDSSPLSFLATSAKTAADERARILKYGAWTSDSLMATSGQYAERSSNLAATNVLATSGTLLGGVSKAYGYGDPNSLTS